MIEKNKTLKLEFRALLPPNNGVTADDNYFYQRSQYLTSFLRRVYGFYKVSHPTYLEKNLEDLLEIKIDGEWVKCTF